jgi:predicted permease
MRSVSIFRALLYLYPAAFRHEYGNQIVQAYSEQLQYRRPASLWLRAIFDVFTIAPKEHLHVILHDIRYALRTLAASPQFAAIAVLSLALGIGANTALFSLWYNVLHSALPVKDPDSLVMLTDPGASGVSIGLETGQRSLLTYAEYGQLRDASPGFTGVMAAQSSIGVWQVQKDGGASEEVRGRLVSGGFFDVLGVAPQLGRTFAYEMEKGPAPYAVISHNFWLRRFGGSSEVIGQTITIRKARLTILGVMPAGFFGETVGQRPDLWVPLTMQAEVQPGRDLLHDLPSDKVMWLRVFARLQPGVTAQRAEVEANAVFKASLEAHYGTSAQGTRESPLDQNLHVSPAATGASAIRGKFSDPLNILLAAVGVVLLIACANLANLLLARGAARQSEIGLRLSLGASRGRIVRQLFTESLVLAAIGGAAGIACAYLLHRALAAMIAESVQTFQMDFRMDPLIFGFTLAATLGSAILFGLLPAWQATRAPGRFARRAPWGRLLVSAQLALSVPLLVGAGLLAGTLYNLQRVDLGYPADHVLAVRLDTLVAGYGLERTLAVLEDLRGQFQRIPGVLGVSYSKNGVFGGRNSGDDVEVEGFTAMKDDDHYSAYDMVGPRLFTSLGIPIRRGRDITEEDRAGGKQVAVINHAFAERFFAGRNPIGMRITNVDGAERTSMEVVGVLAPARMARVRGEVQPVYYVPMTQPLSLPDGGTFAIRTVNEASSILNVVRDIIRRTDRDVSILWARSVEERIEEQLVQDRVSARLAVVFGGVAVVLAAIGLYGLLSYGVARRVGEISIRLALGALPIRVVGMLLRETSVLVIAGLAAGGVLAYGAARLVANQLYGLTASDPLIIGGAVGLLLLAAFVAAWFPAWRASRLDPAIALRRE